MKQKPMILYALGNLPASMLLLAVATWLMRLYCPTEDEKERELLLSPATYGTISSVCMVIAAVADFVVGFLSDRCSSRMGRRKPFIVFGLPFLALSFLLVWFPPVEHISLANIVWLAGTLGVLFVSFTVVVNPYLALMPEVWQDERERIRVSVFMAVSGTLAQVVAFALFGVAISTLSSGVSFLGVFLADGYKFAAVIGFFITVLSFLPTLIFISERPHSKEKEVPFGLFEAGRATLTNKAFLPYLGASAALYAAQFLIEAVLPYLVVTRVVEDESKADMVASLILLGLVVLTAFLYPVADALSRKYKKKDMFLFCLMSFAVLLPFTTLAGSIPFIPPIAHVILGCLLISPALAIGLVIPRAILAEVMDYDTTITGYRREAMYNGMEGLFQKIASGIVPLIQGLLFSAFGYSKAEPYGIVACGFAAGFLSLLGYLSFKRYPLG
jgi:GPH family glycoside/pentoside/hexuronide:cation symporter